MARPRWWKRAGLRFLDKTNLTVTTLTACVNLYTRSAGVAYFTCGAVLCSITVKAVKRCIQQPRPPPRNSSRQKTSYGMPSTHSATISYFAIYILLACLRLPIHPSLPEGWLFTLLPPMVVLPWATIIVMSRVWLGHHTYNQVAVGALYGVIFASGWFMLWTAGRIDIYGKKIERAIRY